MSDSNKTRTSIEDSSSIVVYNWPRLSVQQRKKTLPSVLLRIHARVQETIVEWVSRKYINTFKRRRCVCTSHVLLLDSIKTYPKNNKQANKQTNEEREKIHKKKGPNRRGYGIIEPVVSDEKLLVSSPYSNWQSNKIQSGSVPSVARQGHPEQQQTTTKAKRNIIIRILVTNPQQKPRNKKPTTTTTRVA